jgi:tagaturonate reductase
MEHPAVGPWLEDLLFREIVPALEGRVDDPAAFARTTLDRFRNPFLEHQLSAIALNHEAKVRVRLLPTYEEYRTKFGRGPEILSTLVP